MMLHDPALVWLLAVAALCGSWRQVVLASLTFIALTTPEAIYSATVFAKTWAIAIGLVTAAFAALMIYYVRRAMGPSFPWDFPLHPFEGRHRPDVDPWRA